MGRKPQDLQGILRTAKIIVSALVGGVVVFGVVVVFVLDSDPQPNQGDAVMSMVMAVAGLSCLIARFVVPGLVVASACRNIARGTWPPPGFRQPAGWTPPETDEGKLAQVFLNKTIIGSALLEGAAFANIIAYMLEGQLYSIALGGVFAAAILAGFPTKRGFEAWIEQQTRIVKQIRDMPDVQ